MVHRVYLDTNVYCRPRDNRSQKRIDCEARAFEEIAALSERGVLEILSSDYVKFEIDLIEDMDKREDIKGFENKLASHRLAHSQTLYQIAGEFIRKCRLNALDSLHLSAAVESGAEFFITCDDEVLKKSGCVEKLLIARKKKLIIVNPVEYAGALRYERD